MATKRLFGYSGGGQFVHRHTMVYPHRVAAVGAAGWYTFPNSLRRFPHGVAPCAKLPDLHFNPVHFLRIPACVLVGELDTARDEALRQSPRLDREQGKNRVERGKRWVAAMRNAAKKHGFDTPYRFILLPNSDHSFSRSVKHGGMAKHVFRFLFNVTTQSKVHEFFDPNVTANKLATSRAQPPGSTTATDVALAGDSQHALT